ncbi:MAG: cytochrome c3 family protein [Anaeromyxobacter sp.]
MHTRLIQLAALVLALAAPLQGLAAAPGGTKKFPVRRGAAVKPLASARFAHAPFSDGDCALCHQSSDPARPGPVRKASINEGCFDCHEASRETMARKVKHAPSAEACTDCHNPHNSNEPGLLHMDQVTLCTKCHGAVRAQLASAKVTHGAMNGENRCSACHDPHATQTDGLLLASPMALCLDCHDKDGMTATDGAPLTNFKKWLEKAPNWHEPVKNKDCAACHRVHGGDRFRLLTAAYPEKFYAPWDAKSYALCFNCHDEKLVSEASTTSSTLFRSGKRNLHTLHVAKARGLTCRACHESHAAQHEHGIRDVVPYGDANYALKVGYSRTATGGTCTKTCHETQTYDNTSVVR